MSVEIAKAQSSIRITQRANAFAMKIGLFAGLLVSFLILLTVWFLAAVIPIETGSPFAPIREFCVWLSETRIGIGLLESTYAFPIVEGLHLIGIAVSVGVLCWFDLRLLGLVFTDIAVSKVWKQVMPLATIGFILVFATGGLLFAAEAVTAYASVHFWIKLGLIVLAGVNAAYFELKTRRDMAGWDNYATPPLSARVAGVLSLVFWTLIIVTARTMAYSF